MTYYQTDARQQGIASYTKKFVGTYFTRSLCSQSQMYNTPARPPPPPHPQRSTTVSLVTYPLFSNKSINRTSNHLYYHMTRAAPLAQSHRKPRWELTCVGPDELTWAGPEKAVQLCIHTALFQKLKGIKEKS